MEQEPAGTGVPLEGSNEERKIHRLSNPRKIRPPALLGALPDDALPAHKPGLQPAFGHRPPAEPCPQRDELMHTEFCPLFQDPFEPVVFDKRRGKDDCRRSVGRGPDSLQPADFDLCASRVDDSRVDAAFTIEDLRFVAFLQSEDPEQVVSLLRRQQRPATINQIPGNKKPPAGPGSLIRAFQGGRLLRGTALK